MTSDTSKDSGKLGWLPGATAILAFIGCNGPFVLVAVLSVFGVSIVINPHIQAGMISLFAVLTLVFVFLGYRTHGVRGPMIVSAIGAIVVIGSMYIYFNKIVESLGLVALIVSAVWSWRATRAHVAAT